MKKVIKYGILFPLAAVWDSFTFIAEAIQKVAVNLDAAASHAFDKAVEWCDND